MNAVIRNRSLATKLLPSLASIAAAVVCAAASPPARSQDADAKNALIERGRYLVTTSGCLPHTRH